jgi:hypothetical protein
MAEKLKPHFEGVLDARHGHLEPAAADLPFDQPGIVLRVLDDEEPKDMIDAHARDGRAGEHRPDFSHGASLVRAP